MQEAIDLFVYALKHKTKSSAGEKQRAIKEIQQEIDKNNARIKEAQLMRLDKEIDMIEYLEVKKAYEPFINRLIQQKVELSQMDENLSKYAEEGGDFLKQFPEFFKNLDPKGQQLFLGSVLAEKLVFENNDYRTIKMVKVIERISAINKSLQENKNGTSQFLWKSGENFKCWNPITKHQRLKSNKKATFAEASVAAVALVGPISNQDMASLKKLYELKVLLNNYLSKGNDP